MRIPPGATDDPVADRMRERRGGDLRPLDLALLHNPVLADGWNIYIGALRSTGTLEASLRELMILRVAVLNAASYEWAAHEPVARGAGVSEAQLSGLRAPSLDGSVFSERERAVLQMVEESTRDVVVADDTFASVREHLGDAGAVEVALVAAAYNMVSRFLVALDLTAAEFPSARPGSAVSV